MFQKSRWLFLIILILMLMISIPMIILNSSLREVKSSAKVMNDLSFIRGGIQRYTKLRLTNVSNEILKEKIDETLAYYILEEKKNYYEKEEQETSDLRILQQKWESLQQFIEAYDNVPIDETMDMIILKSEECWSIANYIVLQKQNISQGKASNFNYFMIILGLGMVVVLLLLFLVKRFVRDNLEISNIYDPLTKVFNRRYFISYMNNKISRARKDNQEFSLVMLDIDYFKKVNDTYGHGVGDHILETLAHVVKGNIRKSDLLFRIGGEEFMIVLPNTPMDISMKLAERVRRSVEHYSFNYINGITISLGITQSTGEDDINSIMERADKALYKAKNNGRNRVETENNNSYIL